MSKLTLDELQERAVPRRGVYDDSLLFWSVGLGGESGEVLNVVKKIYRDAPPVVEQDVLGTMSMNDKLVEEAGDVLFYLRQVLAKRGYTLEDAGRGLLDKLDAMGPPLS